MTTKTMMATVAAAIGASACCVGPVVLSLVGAGALGASVSRLEPLRPVFIGLTAVLLGWAFFTTYRRSRRGGWHAHRPEPPDEDLCG